MADEYQGDRPAIPQALVDALIGNRGPYQGASDQLMGMSNNGPPKAYEAQGYPKEVPVRVILPSGEVFDDTMKGLNVPHAVERAYRNWPNAARIIPLTQAQGMANQASFSGGPTNTLLPWQ